MADDLFGGSLPDEPDPYAGMGQEARRTARRRALIASGVHPATRAPIASQGRSCGDCAHLWRKRVGAFTGYKCDQAAERGRDGPDMRVSWPACVLFKERQP